MARQDMARDVTRGPCLVYERLVYERLVYERLVYVTRHARLVNVTRLVYVTRHATPTLVISIVLA